jgi:hypothetical protein
VFLASRSSPWCPFVANIPVPGSFAYPMMQCKQGISRLLGLKDRLCGRKKFTTKAKKAHEDRGLKAFFLFLRVPLCAFVVNILIPGSFAYPVI